AGPPGKVVHGVRPGLPGPIDVKLKLHQRRVGSLQQQVVGNLALKRNELEVVIVIGQLKSRVLRGPAYRAEQRRQRAPVRKRPALTRRDPAADEIAVADRPRFFDPGGPGSAQIGRGHLRGRRREPARGEGGPDRADRPAVVPHELHFLVPQRGHAPQGSLKIPRQLVAYRVELEADPRQPVTRAPRRTCAGEREAAEYRDEAPPVHLPAPQRWGTSPPPRGGVPAT